MEIFQPYIPQILILLIPLVGLAILAWIDPYIRLTHKVTIQGIVLLIVLLLIQNILEYYLANGEPMIIERTITSIFGYVIRPAILVFFLYIVIPDKSHIVAWLLFVINVAVHISALFSPICFSIDEENHYRGGPLENTCLYISLFLLVYLLIMTLVRYGRISRFELILPVFVVVIILLSIFADESWRSMIGPFDFLTIAIEISSVFFYIWLHLQFVREHESALEADRRIKIMFSQIKPHFLFNSLGAIEELCDSDPPLAKEATIRFSRYLRGNLESLSTDELIPFEKELEHTKLYLELEQLRFEDALQVKFDITCTDFNIPTLTVEPLAENAVRHGIRGSEEGEGTVTIRTKEYFDRYEVMVIDDGAGFDPESLPEITGDHIGIRNVKERLQRLCGGTLRISSKPGEGTTVTISIPKEVYYAGLRHRRRT